MKISSNIAFTKRIHYALAASRRSLFAPLKAISKKRILEIDILRSAAILLLVLYHVPQMNIADVSSTVASYLLELIGFLGVTIFFFVSGFSLFISHRTISNRDDVLSYYKKRVVRIYPLYWVFVVGILIFYRLSYVESVIYVAGLQALFYPFTTEIYHFVSVILIFYLLFPLLVLFDDCKKLIIVSIIPFVFFAAMQLNGLSDPMFLRYYGLFVAGIVAGKADVYGKIRQVKFKRYFVFTIPIMGALLALWLIAAERYYSTIILWAFLSNLFGIMITCVILYWACIYVTASRTKRYALFTFVAFSTYGVFFLNTPFFILLRRTLFLRLDIQGTAANAILVAFIPFIVIAGYLLQFATNKMVSFSTKNQKR
jgi:peptidoglycan/LPS O-acetylase OafA/YrhL